MTDMFDRFSGYPSWREAMWLLFDVCTLVWSFRN